MAHALYYFGALRLLQTIRLRRRAVVLMYHRVLTPSEQHQTGSNPGIVVTDDTFARHLALLKQRFTVLSVDQFALHLRRGVPFPDSSCLITFDDGWADNHANAWPRLKEAGMPALIFLPVNFIGSGRMFWRETLTSLLAHALAELRRLPERRADIRAILDEVGLAAVLDVSDADPRAAISEAIAALKGSDAAEIDSLIGRLRARIGGTTAMPDRLMTWDEVASLAADGVAFGGHGAEHVLLDRISEVAAEAEITTAMVVVSNRTAPPVPTFSYPNGNWTRAIAEQVRAAGFHLAFTTDAGPVAASDDPFTLRRVNINEEGTRTVPLFLARVLGLF